MELSKRAINELISLKDEYERKETLADSRFISNALDIIESEDRFHNLLTYEFSDDEDFPCCTEDNKIFINFDRLLKFSKRNLHLFNEDFLEEEMFALRNLEVLSALMHESSHVWYFCGLDDYDEINRLYLKINEVCDTRHGKFIYNIFRSNICIERHANIEATRELGYIYDRTKFAYIPPIFHMVYLDCLYGCLSPVEKTLLFMRVKNDFKIDNIPIPKLIDVGFKIDKETRKHLGEIVAKEARGDICYKKTLWLVNKL